MSSDNRSPIAGQSYNKNDSTKGGFPLGSHNPALAKYNHLVLKPDTIVKPDLFTLYFGFLGQRMWSSQVARTITARVEDHYVLAGRPPTQEELDAQIGYATRRLYYREMGFTAGAFLGGALLYRSSRKSPHFPSQLTPESLLMGLRSASAAEGMKTIVGRAAFRMLFWWSLGGGLASIYSGILDAKSVMTDPRLERFKDEVRKQSPEDVRKRKLQAASERVKNMHAGEQDIGTQMRQGMGSSSYIEGSGYEPGQEIAQPNSYSEYESSTNTASSSQAVSDDSYAQNRSGGAVWARGRGPQPEPKSSLDFLEDDASPTAPEYRNTDIEGSSGGSAWDRIRQQKSGARSEPRDPGMIWQSSNPYIHKDIHDGPHQSDSYKGRERDNAQADFDRLLESERNAGNEGSHGRGWGS